MVCAQRAKLIKDFSVMCQVVALNVLAWTAPLWIIHFLQRGSRQLHIFLSWYLIRLHICTTQSKLNVQPADRTPLVSECHMGKVKFHVVQWWGLNKKDKKKKQLYFSMVREWMCKVKLASVDVGYPDGQDAVFHHTDGAKLHGYWFWNNSSTECVWETHLSLLKS